MLLLVDLKFSLWLLKKYLYENELPSTRGDGYLYPSTTVCLQLAQDRSLDSSIVEYTVPYPRQVNV
jgi:hypothetical protein